MTSTSTAASADASADAYAVELRGVTKRFGGLTAVDALSLAIPRGSVYGFIGPNGAGKTTTIRMIMDIIAPDAGEILIGGEPRTRSTAAAIGYLPEERGLYQKMKLDWTLGYFARLKGMRDRRVIAERIERWLRRFDLWERRGENVEALSKGNQQKVQFITTIIHDPQLVILDEPFSGLDPVNQQLVAAIVAELQAEGRTVIFSTHVMEQAEKLCEAVFMILDGQKMLDGPLGEVKAKFGTGTWAVELAGAGGWEADASFLEGLPSTGRIERREEHGRSFFEVALADGAEVGALIAALAGRADLRRIERLEPSLHDIFCRVAGRDVFVEAAAAGSAA